MLLLTNHLFTDGGQYIASISTSMTGEVKSVRERPDQDTVRTEVIAESTTGLSDTIKRTFWHGFQKVPVLFRQDQYAEPAGRAATENILGSAPDDRPGVSMACSLVEPMASILSVSTEIVLSLQFTESSCALHGGNKHGQPVAFIIIGRYPCAPAGNYRVPRGARKIPQQLSFKTQTVRKLSSCRTCVADGRVIRRGGIGAPGRVSPFHSME